LTALVTMLIMPSRDINMGWIISYVRQPVRPLPVFNLLCRNDRI